MYIYNVMDRKSVSFVVSQFISVARQARCLKLGSNPGQLLRQPVNIITHTHTHTHTHIYMYVCIYI